MCARVNKALEESLAFTRATIVDVVLGQLLPGKTVAIIGPHITEIASTGPVPIPPVARVSKSESFSESSFRCVVRFGPPTSIKVTPVLWLNSAELPINVSAKVPRSALFGGCSYKMASLKASAGSRQWRQWPNR
jgi:hypothetical protein